MEKILIIGGTSFIGRTLVEHLLSQRKYAVTLFNRGKTNPELFKNVQLIMGDRNTEDIKIINQQTWDYIIDVSCYYPNSMENILSSLQFPPKRYVFISTVSTYDNEASKEILRNEIAPLLSCTKEQAIDTELSSYGNRKAACERLLETSSLNYSILRPALVYGPYDPTDRFYYWLYQVKNSHSVLLPKGGIQQFSTTYVKDLVEGIVNLLTEDKREKVYNAVSKPQTTIETIVEEVAHQLQLAPKKIPLSEELLDGENIQEWVDFPLWLDNNYYTYQNNVFLDLIQRPATALADAITETIQYYDQIQWPEPQFGISERRRLELLEKLS